MDGIRKPLFLVALGAWALAWLLELGTRVALHGASDVHVPGLATSYLATFDALVLMTIGWIGFGLLRREELQTRVQGIVTAVVAVLCLLACIGLVLAALGSLMLMIGLLLAAPFGTLAYLAMYGDFPRSVAAALLSSILLLKLVFAGALVGSQLGFLRNKGLVALILVSLALTLLVSFLHGLVPGFLVSITDAVGALVIGVVAAIYALLYAIGGVRSTWRAAKAAV